MKKRSKSRIKWNILIISLVVVYFTAFLGSIFTSPNTTPNSEYYNSVRPAITPPNWVFPVVWNILFFLIALSLYFAWTRSNKKQKKGVAWVFAINLFLNAFWSFLYFGLQSPALAFVELIVLWLSIIAMIYITRKITKLSSCLLIPYFLWVSFAGILNYLSI